VGLRCSKSTSPSSAVFATDGRRNKEIDTWISKVNIVLRYFSVVTKRELPTTAMLSFFKAVFVPIITHGHGHESWLMTDRTVSLVQAAEVTQLRRVDDVTLRGKGQL